MIYRRRAALCVAAGIGLMAGSFVPVKAQTTATYYGSAHEGLPTASGEPFRANGLTAAHPSLPFGTQLMVCKEACTTVRVNDRTDDKTGLDLSQGAAERIGLTDEGRGPVEVAQVDSPGLAEPTEKAPELPRTGGIEW